jgi:predicted homoserine dehydrogenase-like protein
MGPGPYYLFYRPYHLGHIEAMTCIAEAVLDGSAILQPTFGFQTNVYAYAKRDLRKGEQLDGIGGYTCYGLIENCSENAERPGIPICLAEYATLKQDIVKDGKIFMDMVSYDSDTFQFKLFSRALEVSNPELNQTWPTNGPTRFGYGEMTQGSTQPAVTASFPHPQDKRVAVCN